MDRFERAVSTQPLPYWENFTWIVAVPGWIELIVHAPQSTQNRRQENIKRHQLALFHSDAVLACQRSANLHAIPNDIARRLHSPFELRPIAGIEKNQRMLSCHHPHEKYFQLFSPLSLPSSSTRRNACGSFERGITASRT